VGRGGDVIETDVPPKLFFINNSIPLKSIVKKMPILPKMKIPKGFNKEESPLKSIKIKMPTLTKMDMNEKNGEVSTPVKNALKKKKMPTLSKIDDIEKIEINENEDEEGVLTRAKRAVKEMKMPSLVKTDLNNNKERVASISIKNFMKMPKTEIDEEEEDVEDIKLHNTNPVLPFEDMRMYDGHMDELTQGEQRYGMTFFNYD
uniref:Uncharacterized protein n=1 Tax=Panagrolaimus sp. ES5 TaxID=591445 RepID=A0AC34GJ51_9BILA